VGTPPLQNEQNEQNYQDLTDSITAGWKDFLKAKPSAPHQYVYASAWRACTRRMVLDMTACDRLPAWQPEQLANFRRGEDRERDLLADLAKLGRNAPVPFRVIGQQERFELRDHKGRVAIVGKKDAELVFDVDRNGGETPPLQCPLEVKAWHPNIVARISTFDDLLLSPWTRAGAYQLLAYLYGFGRPLGFLLLDRNGLPLPLAVELEPHLAEMEDFLTRAEIALDHLERGSLPDFTTDPQECRRCPFLGSTCNPALNYDAAKVLADAELEAMLERRSMLESAADEYEVLDKQVKARLKGIDYGLCGPFLVEGKSIARKGYAVKPSTYWQMKITKV
jgi:hypothetical protein